MGVLDSLKKAYDSAKEIIGDEEKESLKSLSLKEGAIASGVLLTLAATSKSKKKENNNSDQGPAQNKEQEQITHKTDSEKDGHLVPAVCTQCGAPVMVDPKQDAVICEHCGTPFIVSKAINQYNNQYSINSASINTPKVEVHQKGNIEAALDYIEKKREEKKAEKKQEEERERLEKEQERERSRRRLQTRQEMEEQKREKRKEWFRKYGIKTISVCTAVVFIAIMVISIAVSASRKGKIPAGISSYELKNNNYTFAEEKLRQAGFSDITIIADPDLIIGWRNTDGQVKTVTIGSSSSFSEKTLFYPDEAVIITYHTFPDNKKPKDNEGSTESTEPEEAILIPETSPAATPAPTPESKPEPTPLPTPEATPAPTPVQTPASTPEPTANPFRFSDDQVISTISSLVRTGYDKSEFSVDIEDSMLIVSLYPKGTTANVYATKVQRDKDAIKGWNSLVSSTQKFSKNLSTEVHDKMGRDDLLVAIYLCDDTGSGNVFLVVMDGVVYYDVINEINLLGL